MRVHDGGHGAAREHGEWFAQQRAAAVARVARCERCSRATAGAIGDSARALALKRQPRGALPGELARARARPGARSARASSGSPQQPLDRGGDRSRGRADRTAAPRRRRPRAARRRRSRRPAPRAPSPPAPAARSPRTARGRRSRRRAPTGPRPRSRRASPAKRTSSATPSALRALAQLGLVPGRVAGQHQHRPALGGDAARARRSARARFLCGRLAERLSSTRPSPSPKRARVARPRAAAAARAARRAEPRAARRRSAPRGCRSSSTRSRACDASRRSRGRSGARRAARARACRGRAGRRGPREARVDQVVDRDDAPEAPPRGRRAGEAVHEVDARARGQARQQHLLAEHPLTRLAGVDRHRHGRQQLAPGPVAAAGLAVDERREARARRAPARPAPGSARARRPPCRRSRRARGR